MKRETRPEPKPYRTLAEWPDGRMVRLICRKCGRYGQYDKDTLIACFGAEVPLPELRRLIANCGRKEYRDYCGVRFTDRAPDHPMLPVP